METRHDEAFARHEEEHDERGKKIARHSTDAQDMTRNQPSSSSSISGTNRADSNLQHNNVEQMWMLAGQMSSLKTDVVQLSAQVQQHDLRMSDFERQLKILQLEDLAGRGPRQALHLRNPTLSLRGERKHAPSKNQRAVLVVGGFPDDTEWDAICEKMRDFRA